MHLYSPNNGSIEKKKYKNSKIYNNQKRKQKQTICIQVNLCLRTFNEQSHLKWLNENVYEPAY